MHELRRDRVEIDDAVDAVVVVLKGDEFPDRAQIIAEMQVAGRLNAGKYERLEFGHVVLNRACGGPVSS